MTYWFDFKTSDLTDVNLGCGVCWFVPKHRTLGILRMRIIYCILIYLERYTILFYFQKRTLEEYRHSILDFEHLQVWWWEGLALVVRTCTYASKNFQIHALCKNCKDNSEIIFSRQKMIPTTRIQKSSSDGVFFRLQKEIVSVDDKDTSCCVILIMVSFNALHKERSGTYREKEMEIRELHNYRDKTNNRSTLPARSHDNHVHRNF